MRDTRLVPSVFHFPSHHMTSGEYAKRVSLSAHARTLTYHTRSRSNTHVSHLTLDWIRAPFGIPSRCHCIFDDSLYADHLVVHLARCDYLLDAHDDERRNAHLAGVVMIARTAGCSALQTRDVVRIPSPTSI